MATQKFSLDNKLYRLNGETALSLNDLLGYFR